MYTSLNTARSYVYNVARSLDRGLIIPKVRPVPSQIIVYFRRTHKRIMH